MTEEYKPETSRCSKCEQWKPIKAFYRLRRNKPATICIECKCKYLHEYYRKNRERILSSNKDKALKRRGWKEIRNPAAEKENDPQGS